jgi:hypothetical protein
MRMATISMAILLAMAVPARADGDRRNSEAVRVEVAPVSLRPPPGPIYDEAGRLIVAPPRPNVRSVRDLPVPMLPEPVGAAGFEPGRTSPRKRGEP